MNGSTLETVLRRDRLVVAGALGIIVALAWAYVLWLANDMNMGGMDMTGFRMIPAGVGIMLPASEPWRAIEFAYVFLMWAVMMVGMMAPSAAPMILMYARVGRQRKAEGKPFAATGWFAAGYFLAWTGFSLGATFVQWVIERTALLDSQMASASNVLGGIVLIVAGVYQWTPLKEVCLAMPDAVPIPDAPRRPSRRLAGLPAVGAAARRLLRRLLLGSDGTFVCGRGDECALDRAPRAACPFGETYPYRIVDSARRRSHLCRRRRLDVIILRQ
jgi:hypothetical protein